jgi:hypothetical protein
MRVFYEDGSFYDYVNEPLGTWRKSLSERAMELFKEEISEIMTTYEDDDGDGDGTCNRP